MILKRKLLNPILVGILILLYLTDFFINKIIFYDCLPWENLYISSSLYLKSLICLWGIGIIALRRDKQDLIVGKWLIISGIFVAIGHLAYMSNGAEVNFLSTLKLYLKFSFPFILFCLYVMSIEDKGFWSKIERIVSFIFIVNSLAVICGFILDIDFFRTYGPNRFGYCGLFPIMGGGDATLFFFLALVYFSNKVLDHGKINLGIITSALCIGILGTKAFFCLGTVYILLFSFLYYHRFRRYKPVLILFSFVLLSVLVFVYYQIDYYVDLGNKTDLMYSITSGRSLLFEKRFFSNLEDWSVVNYLFGGTNPDHFDIELDLVNIFLFLGIFGFFYYWWIFYKTILNLNYSNKLHLLFISLFVIGGSFVGRYFYSSINAVYIVLVSISLKLNDKNNTSCKYED
jgi:hypothetical protein